MSSIISYFYKISKYKNFAKGQKGQTIVEFVLLLALLATMSFLFISLVNTNLGKLWQAMVALIIEDPTVDLTLF